MAIKELTINDIKSQYSNQSVLKEAFSTIKNATLVECNDSKAIILDEENQVFYEADYKIDRDVNDLILENFSPIVLKEEKVDTRSIYAKAMNENLNEDDSLSLAKKLARHYARRYVGGDRERLIKEAKAKAGKKKVDKGRKAIIEDLNLFKSVNRRLINEIKNNGFYDKFVEKLNNKYLQDGVTVVVEDKLNFHLISKRSKSKNVTETTYKKRLGSIAESKSWFNPTDVLRNSPSFTSKLDKFMDDVHMLYKSGKDEELEESKNVFAKFASNWPVLYTLSEKKHKDFAIKHFSHNIPSPDKAREYVEIYSALTEGEKFVEDQKRYLEEHYSVTADELNESKISDGIYNARILDEAKRAIETLRSKVDKIESFNVENYLRYSEDKLNEMLRTGRFDEEVFEQVVTDVFGDSQLVILEEDVFDDDDFHTREETQKELTEDEMKSYELEEKAYRLTLELRDLISESDVALRRNLEEEYDLLKSMSSISSYDEERLNSIDKLVSELKKSDKSEGKEIVSEEVGEAVAFCPECHTNVDTQVNEAKESNKDSIKCPSCKSELTV